MKNEEILKIREERNELIAERERLLRLKEDYQRLLSNPDVIKFICLTKFADRAVLTDEEILRRSFGAAKKSKIDIYVRMGYYKNNEDSISRRDYKISSIEDCDYILYKNLEDDSCFEHINPRQKEEFEIIYDVIKLKDNFSMFEADNAYYDLQQQYCSMLLDDKKQSEIKDALIR